MREKVKGHESRRWDAWGKELFVGTLLDGIDNRVSGPATMMARHLGEVSLVDECLGELIDLLDAMKGKTLIMVLSDHGESLGDADYWFDHGENIRYPSMRTPFIIQCGGLIPPSVNDAVVDNTDIAPTILDMLGYNTEEMRYAGRSLVPTFTEADPWPDRLVPMETNGDDGQSYRGARSARYSLQCNFNAKTGALGAVHLYDHRKDPKETINIAEKGPELTKQLMDFMYQSFTIGQPLDQAPPLPLAAETEDALRALGYLD